MQLAEFRAMVRNIVTMQGTTFLSTVDAAKLNNQISRYVSSFCERTRLLYQEIIPFTPAANLSRYSLRDLSVVTAPICWAEVLTINSNPLYNYDGKMGPCSVDQMRREEPTYNTDPAGTPEKWWWTPPYNVQLWPMPTTALVALCTSSNTFFSGYTLHPALSSDSDALVVPDEHLETCAVYVSHKLMNPQADDETVFKMIALYSSQSAEDIASLEGRNERARDRAYARGRSNGWRSFF